MRRVERVARCDGEPAKGLRSPLARSVFRQSVIQSESGRTRFASVVLRRMVWHGKDGKARQGMA